MSEEKDDIIEFEKELEEKVVTQEDSIEKDISDKMNEMGFLWDRVQNKLREDNICFHTKKPLVVEGQDPKDVKIHILEARGVDKGVAAFVAISEEAFLEISKQQEEQVKQDEPESGDEKKD